MIQAICWVLVHSLWQGVLLALAGGGVILCTKRAAAAMRYRLLCGLAGIFMGGMGGTFFYEWAMEGRSGDGAGGGGVSINWLGDWCSEHALQVVAVWLAVAVIKTVRMAVGWSYIRQIRREGLAAPALWVGRLDLLSRQLGIRGTVKLVESALVRVPMVIGQLRPIIYVPLGLINHLPASEMEAVLLHELAHIRRYDHLVNMVQQAAECLLFFNPGFLWISAIIREERENSCDDIAIAHTRDRVEFVRALVRFKEHSIRGMALAFPGNKRQLLHRVVRISRQENKTLSGRERMMLLGGCLVILCLLVAKADVKKKTGPIGEVGLAGAQLAEARPAGALPVRVVPEETVAVLQERERVTQNIEWVKAQLDQLHHKPGVKKKAKELQQAAEQDRQQAAEQGEREAERSQAERSQAEWSQAERDKLQADRDREEAELQAAKDREQAELDRQQADRDHQQAERDRQQAEQDRKQAELDRQQADKDRQQAMRDRQQAEENRKQAERERQRAERGQQKSKNN